MHRDLFFVNHPKLSTFSSVYTDQCSPPTIRIWRLPHSVSISYNFFWALYENCVHKPANDRWVCQRMFIEHYSSS